MTATNTGLVSKLKDTLDNPRLFNFLQLAVAGNQNITRRLIREGLNLMPGEPLLDVCCGTGEFADVALGPYLGIDINGKYIGYARQEYGEGKGHPEREFLAEDITGTSFLNRGLTFPKSMIINSMHHLSDAQNDAVIKAVAQVTSERFVVVDMDPTPSNPVSKFLVDQDRGEFVRPLKEQIALIEPYFKVENAFTYYARLTGQTIIICSVKR